MSFSGWKGACATIVLSTVLFGYQLQAKADETREGYKGVPRTQLFSSSMQEVTDTSSYKKDGPYIIGFSNASINNTWRLGFHHAVLQAAAEHKDMIKQLIVTDANDNPTKQIADIQDLIQRGVDILIVSAATADALDPVVTRAMEQGIPVVMVDRRVRSDNFVSFVTASNTVSGRIMAQWLAEKIGGKGNVIMLGGGAGVAEAEMRVNAAKQVFDSFPGIKVLDVQYTDWSAPKAKTITAALIQSHGKDINGVWSDSGVQGVGALEAFVDAGWQPGTIPPATCADLNGCLRVAVENKIPVINYDYPPGMGKDAVEVALKVLQGIPVPKIYEIATDIVLSKGHDTASVRADKWAEDYVQLDKPMDLILSTGLGPDYDPATFSPDYPK